MNLSLQLPLHMSLLQTAHRTNAQAFIADKDLRPPGGAEQWWWKLLAAIIPEEEREVVQTMSGNALTAEEWTAWWDKEL